MPRPVVALLTDFGLRDHYAGVMKGVILTGCPGVTLVDITHDIPPQDVTAGALELAASWRYFPPGTIFLAVVDPGVGSARRRLAAEAGGFRFVGPDNGLLTIALDEASRGGTGAYHAVELADRGPLSDAANRTFEGRDWFAPAAARLAGGAALADLGPRVETIAPLVLPRPRLLASATEGEVLRIDRFGNLITNIDRPAIARLGHRTLRVEIGGRALDGLVTTYADVQSGALCALFGSTGYLEIALSGGSASSALQAGRGAAVRIVRSA